jgi:hypothetical protein
MTTRKLSTLVLDERVYIRGGLDGANVTRLTQAMKAGGPTPPIVVDMATGRVVDGWHRSEAYRRMLGADGEVEVEERTYASDKEFMLDAITLNAAHGKQLSAYDQAVALTRALEVGLTTDEVATAFYILPQQLGALEARKTARRGDLHVAIKQTAAHMAGAQLTDRQFLAAQRTGGMSPLHYVNQVINLIEGDLVDPENPRLTARLEHLAGLLGRWSGRKRKAS